jgi:hypothetical protein
MSAPTQGVGGGVTTTSVTVPSAVSGQPDPPLKELAELEEQELDLELLHDLEAEVEELTQDLQSSTDKCSRLSVVTRTCRKLLQQSGDTDASKLRIDDDGNDDAIDSDDDGSDMSTLELLTRKHLSGRNPRQVSVIPMAALDGILVPFL